MTTKYAAVAIVYSNRKIMITKENENEEIWSFPSVILELGQSPEDALQRKLEVDYSININTHNLVGAIESEQTEFNIVKRYYTCVLSDGDVGQNEYEDVRWVNFGELKEGKMTPDDKRLIDEREWKIYMDIDNINMNIVYKGDLERYVIPETKTLSMMDYFEGRLSTENGPYKRLIIRNPQELFFDKYYITYKLIVERYCDLAHTEGNITFTKFKQEKGINVYYYCDKQLKEAISIDSSVLDRNEFYFSRPYYLRAQNGRNREGYGWEWDWSGGVGISYEGTYYGETDNYGFVGVIFEEVRERN